MPGPAPKPADQRRRRNAVPGTVFLPAAGRPGPAPVWPLAGKPPTVWYELWRKPQATAWERLSLDRTVARYALVLVHAEKRNATAAVLGEVRQLEDRLGLSPLAMLRLRWEVDEAPPAPVEAGTVTVLDQYRRDLGASE